MRNQTGKGRLGCLVVILVFLIAIYLGVKIIPPYYNAKEFEAQLRTESIKAVAHGYSDESIVKNILSIAKTYEIPLKPKNIKIRRSGESLHINVGFDIPIELEVIKYIYIWHYTIATSDRAVL